MAVRTFATYFVLYCDVVGIKQTSLDDSCEAQQFYTPQLAIAKSHVTNACPGQCSTRHSLRLSRHVCACLRASGKGGSSVLLRTTAPSTDQRRARGFNLYSLNTRAYVVRCGLHTLTGRVSEVSRSGPATSNTARRRRSCVIFLTLHFGGFRLLTRLPTRILTPSPDPHRA